MTVVIETRAKRHRISNLPEGSGLAGGRGPEFDRRTLRFAENRMKEFKRAL